MTKTKVEYACTLELIKLLPSCYQQFFANFSFSEFCMSVRRENIRSGGIHLGLDAARIGKLSDVVPDSAPPRVECDLLPHKVIPQKVESLPIATPNYMFIRYPFIKTKGMN